MNSDWERTYPSLLDDPPSQRYTSSERLVRPAVYTPPTTQFTVKVQPTSETKMLQIDESVSRRCGRNSLTLKLSNIFTQDSSRQSLSSSLLHTCRGCLLPRRQQNTGRTARQQQGTLHVEETLNETYIRGYEVQWRLEQCFRVARIITKSVMMCFCRYRCGSEY